VSKSTAALGGAGVAIGSTFVAKGIAAYSIPTIMSLTGIIGPLGTVHGALTSTVMSFAAAPVAWVMVPLIIVGATGGLVIRSRVIGV
jgi:acyl-coenzyme A thioesterase PaaI-like protein